MKVNKLYLSLLLIIIVLLISSCTQKMTKSENVVYTTPSNTDKNTEVQQPEETDSEEESVKETNFKTYNSPAYRIRINYPDSWEKLEQTLGAVVLFRTPKENDSDIMQENLNIGIEELSSEDMTLEDYESLSIDQLEEFITNIEILDTLNTNLDGYPAKKIIFTGRQGKHDLKWMMVFSVKEGKAYIITYTASRDGYYEYLDSVEEMIDSFEITT